MKPHKVILKVVYGVVGLSVIAIIALTVYQQQQIRKMSKTESPASSENRPSTEVRGDADAIKRTPKNADPDIDKLNRYRDVAEEAPVFRPDGNAETTKDTNAIVNSYAALFKKLALSPEKQDTFKALLVDQQMRKTNLSMEMLDTSISEEKRGEIQQQMEILETESNEKIRKILGTDNFEKYLTYEESLSERTLLTVFFRSLGPDETLTGPREQALIDAMFEERKKVEAAHPRDYETSSPADLEMQISNVMKTTDQTHREYIKVADMYLPPSQTEQFKNFLRRRRDMMEKSLNAMRQVFGSNPDSYQTPEEPDDAAN